MDVKDVIRNPGLYSADDLRRVAAEFEIFLHAFRDMESLLGYGNVNRGMIEGQIKRFHDTADIVEQRDGAI